MQCMDNRIIELNHVADGGSSRVLKKILVINGNETSVAMKIVNKKSNEADRELKTYSEIKSHENIIKFYESRHEPDKSYTFVLEFAELGSLREVSVIFDDPVTENVDAVALHVLIALCGCGFNTFTFNIIFAISININIYSQFSR
ncbi:1229_t:CDS:2 [Acaulospora morrowiae]|uniref:1229_t:CDS:1 n=1 Tax=Acaulospora morrowiae TaxID=94023 RepID=A0A9N8ZMN0_9GLOM|nr:1229_t:CDS:2 [Acaulospora morrowiae]